MLCRTIYVWHVHIGVAGITNITVSISSYPLINKDLCVWKNVFCVDIIQLFNLDDQIIQVESRQILFGIFEPFQIYVNSNLYKRICLCVQLSLLSGSKGEQHSLKINIEVSFTFSESVAPVGHGRLIFPGGKKLPLIWKILFCVMASQSKETFSISSIIPETCT